MTWLVSKYVIFPFIHYTHFILLCIVLYPHISLSILTNMCEYIFCIKVLVDNCYVHYLQLDRHMRRLDHDLNRFTIELEADTGGITEILEQSEQALFNKYKHLYIRIYIYW